MNWPKSLILAGNIILDKIYTKDTTPNKKDVLRFLKIKPCKIKIVILGQDPYPTKGVANGRAFAVNKNIKIPQSLNNIFKEIKEIRGNINTDRTLKHWEKQGVLLLNTSLTVKHKKPNSDKNEWKEFSNSLISWIDKNLHVTWVLWGNEAKKFKQNLKNKVIFDAHPSPLSFYRRTKITFKEINTIDW